MYLAGADVETVRRNRMGAAARRKSLTTRAGSSSSRRIVEVPKTWSILATKVVVSKYFYGENGTAEREHSVRQLVRRVTRTIADWGKRDGYFASDKDAEIFYDELTWLCVNQYGSFNSRSGSTAASSPSTALANTAGRGTSITIQLRKPSKRRLDPIRISAVLRLLHRSSIGDTMEDIMELARSEAVVLFKYGSGTNADLSSLRSSREKLFGGGRPSGSVVVPQGL